MLVSIDLNRADMRTLELQAAARQTNVEDFFKQIILKEIYPIKTDLSPFLELAGNIDIDEQAVNSLRQGSTL
ncbi:MAG: hypothetical protein IKN12_04135 [Selenomonadaceae bacterium]|nr:hypothetical protein [Selenomonadaceae bacterium]MBR3721934.1 hypothetical protein [Selenomonadaceae bacterium]